MTAAVERRAAPASVAYALDLVFVLLLLAVAVLLAAGERGGETFTSNLRLSLPALAAALAGLGGGAAAAVAVNRNRPVSAPGRIALQATLALPPTFVLAVVVGALWEDAQPVLGTAFTAAPIAILAAAVYARVARNDRGALLIVPLVVGVVVAVWLVFELALPH